MKYIVKRSDKTVGVETTSVFDACTLGFRFAANHPELVEAGWAVYCKPHRGDGEDGGETYHTAFVGGTHRAQDIANRINNPPPPPPPVHDCPKCNCKPGCCR